MGGLDMGPGSRGTDRNQDIEMVGQPVPRDVEVPSDDQVVEVDILHSHPGVAGSHCLVAEDRTVGTLEEVRIVDILVVHLVEVHNPLEAQDVVGILLLQEDVGLAENNQDNSQGNHCEVGTLEAAGADMAGLDTVSQKPCAEAVGLDAAVEPETCEAGVVDVVIGQDLLNLVVEARERLLGGAEGKVLKVCAEAKLQGVGHWEAAAVAVTVGWELRLGASELVVELVGWRLESVKEGVHWPESEAVEWDKLLQRVDLEAQLGVGLGLKCHWFEGQRTLEDVMLVDSCWVAALEAQGLVAEEEWILESEGVTDRGPFQVERRLVGSRLAQADLWVACNLLVLAEALVVVADSFQQGMGWADSYPLWPESLVAGGKIHSPEDNRLGQEEDHNLVQ